MKVDYLLDSRPVCPALYKRPGEMPPPWECQCRRPDGRRLLRKYRHTTERECYPASEVAAFMAAHGLRDEGHARALLAIEQYNPDSLTTRRVSPESLVLATDGDSGASSEWSTTRPCSRCGGTGVEQDDRVIGADLRSQRKRADRSLRWLAVRLGLSAAYLSDLELGRRHWSADKITAYTKALR